MKNKIFLTAALFSIAISFMSCKKEYVCKCSKTYSSGSGSTTNEYSEYIYKENRVRAEERCDDNTKSGTDFWGEYSINCQIQ